MGLTISRNDIPIFKYLINVNHRNPSYMKLASTLRDYSKARHTLITSFKIGKYTLISELICS